MASIKQNIEGYTKLNLLTTFELDTILPQLQNYIGKKISIQSGWSKTFHVEHYTPKNTYLRTYLSVSYGYLILHIDTTVKDGEFGCIYYKNTIYLGNISKDGILTSLESFESLVAKYKLNEVFNETEIKDKFDLIEKLQNEISNLKQSISNFL